MTAEQNGLAEQLSWRQEGEKHARTHARTHAHTITTVFKAETIMTTSFWKILYKIRITQLTWCHTVGILYRTAHLPHCSQNAVASLPLARVDTRDGPAMLGRLPVALRQTRLQEGLTLATAVVVVRALP